MSPQTVFIHLPSPFPTQQLHVPPSTRLDDLPLPEELCLPLAINEAYLRTLSRHALPHETRLDELQDAESPNHPINLFLGVRVLGGKGGFGTQLRMAGGRMSQGKSTNVDSCRDLSGRRLSTIKEAQRQAELLESAPALRAAAIAGEKAKLEALERTLGISSADVGESSKRAADVDVEELARKKHKFDDNKFLEESREIKDNVRSAVSAAMLLKKKKKAKADAAAATPAAAAGPAKAGVAAAKKAEKDKVAMPPPASTASSATAVSAA